MEEEGWAAGRLNSAVQPAALPPRPRTMIRARMSHERTPRGGDSPETDPTAVPLLGGSSLGIGWGSHS